MVQAPCRVKKLQLKTPSDFDVCVRVRVRAIERVRVRVPTDLKSVIRVFKHTGGV